MRVRTILVTAIFALGMIASAMAAQVESSLDNPVPVGTAAPVGDYTVKVVNFIPDATDLVLARNAENDPPGEGHVYAIVVLEVGYNGADVGKASGLNLQFVGAKKAGLTDIGCAGPDRKIAGGTFDDAARGTDIFPGGTVQYEQCIRVPVDEMDGLTLYLQTPDGNRVFFELAQVAPVATPAASPEPGS